ncbi:MAG: hypothetical protein IAE79_17645 [Anaerolinea sp.]|nr:hypothetical protein [Anaerolinea sp.]
MNIPDNLRQALEAGGELVCFAMEINEVASIVIKATDRDLAQWRGKRPVGLQPQLGLMNTGAALALVVTIFEFGGSRFTAETTLNVDSEYDLELLNTLARQRVYHVHFFNGCNEYQFSKEMPFRSQNQGELKRLIGQAQRHNAQCARLDWARAKADFFAATSGRW